MSSQATATFSLVQQWDLADNIVGLSFDTTASNSGWQNGTCLKIKILLEKKLFYFACRHHILERLPSAAWQVLFGCTHSLNNEYFKEFQEKWDYLGQG